MNGITLLTSKKAYTLIFGLNRLMEIEQSLMSIDKVFSSLVAIDYKTIRNLLYFGLQRRYSFDEIDEIISEFYNSEISLEDISRAILDSLCISLGFNTYRDSIGTVSFIKLSEKLFPIFVGELGFSPIDFYCMTPHELSLANKGSLERQQKEINNMLLALKLSYNSESEMFNFSNELGFSNSTLEEREETFKAVGLI